MATHSSIFAWKIPWTEEPGGIQSMGLQRVGHNWSRLQFILNIIIMIFWSWFHKYPNWTNLIYFSFTHHGSHVCVCTQFCPTLCDSIDCSPPGSTVHWIFQARILQWVAGFYSRGSSQPRDRTHISYVSFIGRQILYHCAIWEAL